MGCVLVEMWLCCDLYELELLMSELRLIFDSDVAVGKSLACVSEIWLVEVMEWL